jgi:hypothetical protein
MAVRAVRPPDELTRVLSFCVCGIGTAVRCVKSEEAVTIGRVARRRCLNHARIVGEIEGRLLLAFSNIRDSQKVTFSS